MAIAPEFRHDLFWKKIKKTDGCWEWDSAKTSAGYGVMNVRGTLVYAHRVSYEIANGDPDGLHVLHKCDNPSCVNPSHLFLGTQSDNNKDKTKKGRCPHGSDHYKARQTEKSVQKIRELYKQGVLQNDLAKRFRTTQKSISLIVNRLRWKHV